MGLTDKLFDELLKSLPERIKGRMFPTLLLVLVEIGTYFFFSFFFFASLGAGTFRRVLTTFGWQVTAIAEVALFLAIMLLLKTRASTVKSRRKSAIAGSGAVALLILPVAFYFFFQPRTLPHERFDIYYLDYPEPVAEFDKNLLLKLLNHGGEKLSATFNWIDWSSWTVPADFHQLDPLEQVDRLAAMYKQRNPDGGTPRNPIAITTRPLPGSYFSIAAPLPRVNLAVITAADWQSEFAPPSVYEYLVHSIFLVTLRYRLNDRDQRIPEHKQENVTQAYFDRVIDKRELRTIICAGHFQKRDEDIVRQTLGEATVDSYKQALSLSWLRDEALQRGEHFTPDCFK